MVCQRFTPSAVAYASTTLGATLLSAVFGALYVTVFAKHWGITEGWFQTSQAVYLVWNAINDPLFGWLQDRPGSAQNNKRAYSSAILWGGPLFGLSFLLPWMPIGDWIGPLVGGRDAGVGIHCCISLALFDGMFTYCVLAQCGLFAELESSQEARSMVLAASQVATALGGTGMFLAYPLLPPHMRQQHGGAKEADPSGARGGWMPAFFALACVLAVIATGCFTATGVMVMRSGKVAGELEEHGEPENAPEAPAATAPPAELSGGSDDSDDSDDAGPADAHRRGAGGGRAEGHGSAAAVPAGSPEGGSMVVACAAELRSVLWTWCEILSSRDFCLFVACNFLQVFDNTFNAALHVAAMPAIFRGSLSDTTIGILLGAGGVVAPALSLALTPVLLRVGHSFPMIRWAFAAKVLLALAAAVAAGLHFPAPSATMDHLTSGVTAAAAFMVLQRALGSATFGWFPLAVSDIIDADKRAFRRSRKLATSVFGLNALIVKPAESLAPMLFAPVLHDFAAAADADDASPSSAAAAVSSWWSSLLWVLGDKTPSDGEVSEADRALVAWRLVWGVPVVCGILQLLLWNFYRLRGPGGAATAAADGAPAKRSQKRDSVMAV